MFEMTRTALSKVGLCDNPDDEDQLEDQTEVENTLPKIIVQELTEVPKQAGLVEPFVIDPQKDLEILTPLLGVFKSAEEKMKFECPECEDVTHHKLQDLDLDEECPCSNDNCDYEGIVGDFYEGEESHTFLVKTTRHIMDNEVTTVLHGADFRSPPWYKVDEDRSRIKEYYAALHGFGRSSTVITAPVTVHNRVHCSEHCKETGCDCADNRGIGLRGHIRPMPIVGEDLDDDFDEDD